MTLARVTPALGWLVIGGCFLIGLAGYMPQKLHVFFERLITGGEIALGHTLDHALVIAPHLAVIGQVGIDRQTERFICNPISAEHPLYKGVIQPLEKSQMQAAMFFKRDFNRVAVQTLVGTRHQLA